MYANSHGQEISKAAFYALKAARMQHQIGRYAAQRYALNNGSTAALLRLALQLQAAA